MPASVLDAVSGRSTRRSVAAAEEALEAADAPPLGRDRIGGGTRLGAGVAPKAGTIPAQVQIPPRSRTLSDDRDHLPLPELFDDRAAAPGRTRRRPTLKPWPRRRPWAGAGRRRRGRRRRRRRR